MIIPKNYDELAQLIETNAKVVLFFTADWCQIVALSIRSCRRLKLKMTV